MGTESKMSAVKALNPKAEVARAAQALSLNISAARGLQDVLKSNLGPKGTMKMLVSGAGDIKLTQIKDAIHDGLRAVKNAIEDECVVPGAGAFEVAAHGALVKHKETIKGRARLGVQAYADALLVIPKVLATNSGLDAQESIVKLQEESVAAGQPVGLDISSGEALIPADSGILDNYRVKKQILHSCTVIASNLLLVDEVMRAGMSSLKG